MKVNAYEEINLDGSILSEGERESKLMQQACKWSDRGYIIVALFLKALRPQFRMTLLN